MGSYSTFTKSLIEQLPRFKYELPDGISIDLSMERFQVPEIMFHPLKKGATGGDADGDKEMKAGDKKDGVKSEPQNNHGAPDVESPNNMTHQRSAIGSLPDMIYDVVKSCDPDVRRELLNQIVICGKGSQFKNLNQRLHAEIASKLPSSMKVRLVTGTSAEQKHSAYVGSSILASLGSFQQM